MSGWADIALENQALLTKALEKLAAAERERDTARDLAVSLENLVHEARADAERVRAELVETAARGLALEVESERLRADDPGALVAESRKLHQKSTTQMAWCFTCDAAWPCLPARLADALEQAQKALADEVDQHCDYVAETTEAALKMADALLAAQQANRTLAQNAYESGRLAERLADDALTALAGAHVGTPVEGYIQAPYCLKGDIQDLVKARDAARAEAAALREGLRSLAWGEKDDTGNPNYDACEVCGWYRFRGCHAETCALVPLLARLAPS